MIYTVEPDTHPALHNRVPDFDFTSTAIDPKELETNLFETMLSHRGIGLAANQCALPYRVFVMKIDDRTWTCFNPILSIPGEQEDILLHEGCLSFPGLELNIKRKAIVAIDYLDADGKACKDVLGGWAARCALHENDHLNGVVFTSLVSKLKLDMARKKKTKRGR